jgi:predicted dehydrogenase
MSHRFDMDKTSLREELRSGRNGRLDYLSCRYSTDLRRAGCWGFRHEMDHPLLLEGAVHHLELLSDMAGAPVETVFASTWNPPWSDFKNHAQGLVQMTCENGVRIAYEGADTNAVGLHPWANEYIRADVNRHPDPRPSADGAVCLPSGSHLDQRAGRRGDETSDAGTAQMG